MGEPLIGDPGMNDSATLFQQERSRLFGLAYRLTGSRADAEDLVQDAWLRWQGGANPRQLENVPAYLARIVINLSMDRWRDLKRERTDYTGLWLPEPWTDDAAPGPEHHAETQSLLSTAWLMLLEKLNPLERAVFVLREAFDYSFAEIAGVVERSEVNCRQLDRRARQRLQDDGLRFSASQEQQQRLLQRFQQALTLGDLSGLSTMLSEDVRLYSDGGGEVIATLRLLQGLDRIRDFLAALLKRKPEHFHTEIRVHGSQPALWQWWQGQLIGITTLACDGDQITAIFNQRCPSKLRRAGVVNARPDMATMR